MSLDKKRHLVHRENSPLSIVKQCELLEIHLSGIYFKPKSENNTERRHTSIKKTPLKNILIQLIRIPKINLYLNYPCPK